MQRFLILLSVLNFYLIPSSFADWTKGLREERSFVENRGQFSTPREFNRSKEEIKFVMDAGPHQYYFLENRVWFEFSEKHFRDRTEEEKEYRKKRKAQGFNSLSEWQEFQKSDRGKRIVETRDVLEAIWLNTSPKTKITPVGKKSFYYSYTYKDNGKYVNVNEVPGYEKLIYEGIYKNVDLVYEIHPQIGIKYSLIVKPGADLTQIKLQYSKDFQLLPNGNIRTNTLLGDVIDHAPVSYYADNVDSKIISAYKVEGNVISFNLVNYDKTKTIVIDPWTQTPGFATNWDCVWECERDGAGNVYIIGGVMPLQLLKYDNSGNLQWTYNTPYDTSMWLGTFATDNAGNSYVTNGSNAMIQKIGTNGSLLWNNSSPGGLFSSTEFWNIAFNCDQTRLIIGGTGGNLPPLPYIYEMDMSNGNVLVSKQVTGGQLTPTQEVRSITACGNGKYFYLTHDSMGYIHQNFNSCNSSGGTNTKFPHNYQLNYKCENYRYDNSGIMAVRFYKGFVYIHRGNQLHKRNFNNGALVGTVNIPGGSFTGSFGRNQVGCSGIDIDSCGNIYVGSTNAVVKFDVNLTQLASYPVSFNVYDVHINTGGEIIACGSTGNSNTNSRTGYITSINGDACTRLPIVCCDATVCPVRNVCVNAAPVTLNPVQPGGTFSGPGVNGNTFNPSVAGVGTHTVVYTLPCGSDSIRITVSGCATLNVCNNGNGTYTVSGGTGTYSWQTWNPGGNTPITNQAQCTACGYTWNGFVNQCLNGVIPVTSCSVPAGYQHYATGTTVTAPTQFPVRVVTTSGDTAIINNAASVPSCNQSCPTATLTITNQSNVRCFGGSDGSATINATGGTAPYTYSWVPGNLTGATQNNLTAGTYIVYVTHGGGSCKDSIQVTITQPASAVNASISNITNTACGSNNGSATGVVNGGTAPYTYTWSPSGGNAATANNLSAGTYTLTVADANGCQDTAIATITSTNGPTVTLDSKTDVLCFGQTTGSATVSVSGGTAPYTYSWSPTGGTAATANNLAAGSYTVMVSDNGGCSSTLSVTINQPASAVNASITSVTSASCGSNNGSATASVTGGVSPYTYTWSPSGGNNLTANNLGSGSYILTATDANGCTDTALANINSTDGPTVTLGSKTDVLCFGQSTGSASVSVSGGTGPYTYSWFPSGGNAPSASNLAAGAYTVQVRDNTGCVGSLSITINQPSSAVNASIAFVVQPGCGLSNGSITGSVSGGTSPYTYTWSPSGGNGISANNLPAGNYLLTVTDANGCRDTAMAILNTSPGPTVILDSKTDATCFGKNDGSATVFATNGSGPYTFTWTPGNLSGASISNVAAGNYIVQARDQNGCVSSLQVTISQPAPIQPNSQATPMQCGQNDGSIVTNVTGGTPPYTYLWSPGNQTTPSISNLTTGSYTVIVRDSNNCTVQQVVNVGSTGNLPVQINPVGATIIQGTTIQLSTNPANFSTYTWSPSATLSCVNCPVTVAKPVETTIYTVRVTDGTGCTGMDTVVISVEIKCGEVFFPTIFSPNDDGNNDVHCLLGNCVKEAEWSIYNRWGERIFKSSNKDDCWDGTYKGKPVNTGVYVFKLKVILNNGQEIEQTGNITVVR